MAEQQTQSSQGYNLAYFHDHPPQTEQEIVAFVDLKTQVYNYFMHSLHRQWYEDLLWYYGEQNMEYNWQMRRFTVKRAHPGIPRTMTNLIYPKCEVGMQLFLDSLPEAVVKAATRDIEDRLAADVAQKVSRFLQRENQMQEKRAELAGWVVVTGNGFMIDYLDRATKQRARVPVEQDILEPKFDPETQQPVIEPNPETGEPQQAMETKKIQLMGPDGNPVYQEMVLPDVNTDAVAPFEIIPDFSARHPWEQRHFVHYRARDIGWLKDQFGAKAADLKPESGLGTSQFYQFKVLELVARAQTGGFAGFSHGAMSSGGGEFLFMENSTILKTYFEIPSDQFPKGRIYAVASGKVLFSGDYSDLYGDTLCLGMYGWSKLPGSLYCFGMVRNLIDPQRRLNGLDTQRALVRKTMGNPQWLVARGSQFSVTRGSNVPGQINTWRARPNFPPPTRFEGKSLPADAENERDNIKVDMNDVSGVWYTLSGQNPPGVDAGISLEFLTEMAGKRFKPIIERNREMMRRQELNRLRMAQRAPAWKMERTITVMGEDSQLEAQAFTAADFTGEIDVEIEAVNPSLFSEAQKKADAMAFVENDLIDTTLYENRDRLRRLAHLSDFKEAVSADAERAVWENQQMLAGRVMEVTPFENSEIHLSIHEAFLKRTDLDRFDPKIVHLYMEHVAQTTAALAEQEKLGAQGDAAEAGGGGNGEPPPPGQSPKPRPGQPQSPPQQQRGRRNGRRAGPPAR